MSNTSKNQVKHNFKMTELGPLPEDWEVVRLGEIAEYINGYAFKASEWAKKGKPIIRIQNLTGVSQKYNYFDGKLDEKYLVKPGDILISWSASLDIFIWNGPEGWLNQHIFKVQNIKSHIDQSFFYYAIKKVIELLRSKTHGSTMKHVTRRVFTSIPIPLPPLPEQKAIARVLKTIQDAMEATERVIAAAKELKKSLMRHLFTYGPVPVAERDRVRLKQTEIGPIPEDWEVVRLGEIIDKAQYGLSKRGHTTGYVPILRMNNIVDGKIDTTSLQFIDLTCQEIEKFRLNKGDILFNRTNSLEWVGKTAFFDLDGTYVFASYLIRLKVNMQKADPFFINAFMNWSETQKRLKAIASRGVSQSNISATKLKNFCIPLPLLPVQQKIAQILKAVDEKIEAEEKKKEALQALFKTMLHHLMTGKIRVKH